MAEFLALALLALALGAGSIAALKLKIPPLIIFLLMGMIVGGYGLLQKNDIITFLGNLGSILLLFAIGSEFSIYKLISSGFLNQMKVAIIEILISFVLLFFIFSIWFSFGIALLLALTFSITSTGVSLKLLQELNLTKKFDISLIIKISVIEDLISVFIFTLISSFSLSQGHSISALVVSFLVSMLLFILAYYFFSTFINRLLFRLDVKEEDLLMLALGILLLMVSLAGILNLSTSFGAYISGSIVSTWKEKWKGIERDLKNFSYIFISFFFLTIGLQVSFSNIDLALLIFIIPVIIIVKFVGVYVGTYHTFNSGKVALFTSFGMLSRGELTLAMVSAAVAAGLLPQSFLGFSAIVVLSTILAAFILLKESGYLYDVIRTRFPKTAF